MESDRLIIELVTIGDVGEGELLLVRWIKKDRRKWEGLVFGHLGSFYDMNVGICVAYGCSVK